MQVAIDISLYPLTQDYEPSIIAFIQQLRQADGLRVHTNTLSTQVTGEYNTVMAALQSAMKTTFQNGHTHSFVLKVLNVEVEPGAVVEIG
ncbi:MAG: YkoF family thiamine/hydroxymethylpyrimidine-binding protein [Bacteroidota bacterium]